MKAFCFQFVLNHQSFPFFFPLSFLNIHVLISITVQVGHCGFRHIFTEIENQLFCSFVLQAEQLKSEARTPPHLQATAAPVPLFFNSKSNSLCFFITIKKKKCIQLPRWSCRVVMVAFCLCIVLHDGALLFFFFAFFHYKFFVKIPLYDEFS